MFDDDQADESIFEGADATPALGPDWSSMLRVFADIDDSLSRLRTNLDELNDSGPLAF